MPNAKDLKMNPNPSILLVGDGGTRKTRFLAGCPKPFIFDFDAGMASTRGMDVEYETFKDAPWGSKATNHEAGIYAWGESWPRFVDFLNKNVWPGLEDGSRIVKTTDKREVKIETLGADSLTTLATQCMNYVLKASGKAGNTNPEIQHWGSQLRLLETIMEQLAAWPSRLVVTAHIKRDDNLVMGTKEFLPLVAGQLSGKIGVYFDECYYTSSSGAGKDAKVLLKTEGEGLYKQAKSRHNVPNNIEASWAKIAPFFQ
jgi:hypothetical protein